MEHQLPDQHWVKKRFLCVFTLIRLIIIIYWFSWICSTGTFVLKPVNYQGNSRGGFESSYKKDESYNGTRRRKSGRREVPDKNNSWFDISRFMQKRGQIVGVAECLFRKTLRFHFIWAMHFGMMWFIKFSNHIERI